jgi:hypothetical protein
MSNDPLKTVGSSGEYLISRSWALIKLSVVEYEGQ